MEAGKLRHKITIKSRAAGRNSYGESTDTWTDVKTLRVSIEPLLGREYFAAEAAQSEVEVKFKTRYVAGIENKMRVQHGADLYEILSAVNVENRNVELLLYCKKVV